MRRILIFTLIILCIEAQCACTQLTQNQECLLNSQCSWTGSNCITGINRYSFCISLTGVQCRQQPGCGYMNGKCDYFVGCSGYMGSNNSVCQAINPRCNSDGEACVEGETCMYQRSESSCLKVLKRDGSQFCLWSNQKCRHLDCSDGIYKSNTECNAFLAGCISNGQTCTNQLLPCSQYRMMDCTGLLGTDGLCTRGNGQYCKLLDCTASYSTDLQCQIQAPHCRTNGIQCVNSLSSCSSYPIAQCPMMIGVEGQCYRGLLSCRGPQCTDYTSNCEAFKGCYSNGMSCVQQLQSCSQYTTNCSIMIGLEGPCTYTLNGCTPRQCSQVTVQSNCSTYLKGCQWNGQSCVSQLQPCSSYPKPCSRMIGSNGPCDDTCNVLKCSDTNCVSPCAPNFTSGCSIPKPCSQFQTRQDCQSLATTDTKCIWDSICRVQKCSDYFESTTDLCNSRMPGCISDGLRCLNLMYKCTDVSNPLFCTTIQNQNCLWNQGKCIPFNDCSSMTPCSSPCRLIDGVCSANKTCDQLDQSSCTTGIDGQCGWDPYGKCRKFWACTDIKFSQYQVCNAYNSNCTSNGQSCIALTSCRYYDISSCIIGTDGNCIWDQGQCRKSTCNDLSSDCEANGCTQGPKSCVSLLSCSQYITKQQCNIGIEGQCYFQNSCQPWSCAVAVGDCVSQGCLSDGVKCYQKDFCSNYHDGSQCTQGLDGPCIMGQYGCQKLVDCAQITDETTCNTQPACTFTNGCIALTCAMLSICTTITYLNGTQTACSLNNTTCTPQIPTYNNCYARSLFYSSDSSGKCRTCSISMSSLGTTTNALIISTLIVFMLF